MEAKLRLIGDEKLGRMAVPVASATVIDANTLVSYESGLAVVLNAQTEDATFIGVSEGQTKAGETDDISVIQQCVAEVTVVSAAYTIGQSLQYNDANALTDGTANTIGWSREDTGGSSVTTLKVLFDVVQLSKLFGIDA
ncbi:MAG: hypothetical protein ACC656_03170 [Candidatus Heimdallarchaeota archaeon]